MECNQVVGADLGPIDFCEERKKKEMIRQGKKIVDMGWDWDGEEIPA